MNKQAISNLLTENYTAFVNYLNTLTEEEFLFSVPPKWTAGQQLAHIVLCVKPLLMVFSMDKAAIEGSFGKTEGEGLSYDALLEKYLEKFREGGKAPERFVPATISFDERKDLCETLQQLITQLNAAIATFSEAELDTLLIPHPLLGNITLREMLYNAIYHVKHHQNQAMLNLDYAK